MALNKLGPTPRYDILILNLRTVPKKHPDKGMMTLAADAIESLQKEMLRLRKEIDSEDWQWHEK